MSYYILRRNGSLLLSHTAWEKPWCRAITDLLTALSTMWDIQIYRTPTNRHANTRSDVIRG